MLRALTLRRSISTLPQNEAIRAYEKGSDDRKKLDESIKKLMTPTEIPICIGDKELKSDNVMHQKMSFDHAKSVAKFYHATESQLKEAIDLSIKSRNEWALIPLNERLAIFDKVADLCAGKYRYDLMASTMLGQGKVIYQAEIDSTCETIDFLRFNVHWAHAASQYQPISHSNIKNSFRLRSCEGFWAAIPPFNFTAIATNLAAAPVMMGNSVLLKPSDNAVLSNYIFYKIMREAGVPAGVVNFIPSEPNSFIKSIVANPLLAGVNFTGSKDVFQTILKTVYNEVDSYRGFPRITGECGGKNFHFIHPNVDLEAAVESTIRSCFEFSGQKCSAASRIYLPKTLWPKFKEMMVERMKKLKIGSPLEDGTFTSGVISDKAFSKVQSYIELGKNDKEEIELVHGSGCDSKTGYFIQPTLFLTTNPQHKLMKDDIFGPLATAYLYAEDKVDETLAMINDKSDFALTGAIFSKDEDFIQSAMSKLFDATGNFYINTQSTGAVVGQQPFGGARLSGTNDKPGGPFYVLKFVSPQSIKRVY